MTADKSTGSPPIDLKLHLSIWEDVTWCYAVLEAALLHVKIIRRFVCTTVPNIANLVLRLVPVDLREMNLMPPKDKLAYVSKLTPCRAYQIMKALKKP